MPRKSRLKLPELDLGEESLGQRLARLRKEKGYTQIELAEKKGLVQGLVSDYERDKLRSHAAMVIRFAQFPGCFHERTAWYQRKATPGKEAEHEETSSNR